ncbi:plasmid stabilization system [Haloplanus rallus]|uniref:Plasmid stabilization system n=1 Tax=Haloplanus rallus TaxID=1816183 RepID=A0A6B9FH61_9EURY|nr:plasmid stabilization system [Haloplanus rallus]
MLVSRDSNPARRTHTAFYDVLEADGEVRVIGIVDVDEAHKRYGFD